MTGEVRCRKGLVREATRSGKDMRVEEHELLLARLAGEPSNRHEEKAAGYKGMTGAGSRTCY